MNNFLSVHNALTALKAGKMIIVVDDEDRENEGDLVMAASKVTSDDINFMMREARGLICVPISQNIAHTLDFSSMVERNTERVRTNFTVSVDFKHGTTTGISATDRAKTANAIASIKSNSSDFLRPGHMFPLIAQEFGVMTRTGHTEAAVDLMRMSGFRDAAVICEIASPNGEMMRFPELKKFARKHSLEILSIADLVHYRKCNENFIELKSSAKMPTGHGDFEIKVFGLKYDHQEAVVIKTKRISENPLVRVHSECFTGEVLGSLRCDCAEQLHKSLDEIHRSGNGMVIYLHQEGRGIGLSNKIKAYHLQDEGFDTYDANVKLGFKPDSRDYFIASQVLKYFKCNEVQLLTNNPTKIEGLKAYGIKVSQRIPVVVEPNAIDVEYLRTKKRKFHHLLPNVQN